ncbi:MULTISPECIES: hypothetical protein [Cyanophyceae]|uniref:Uncharacterized protein n=1 Tax=Stenomitos frigidus AS-A4 TaxID=2933935 RepID=A0ABV0KW94_9CYAN|nr:hypothetical protein [Phormidium sp. FACHB-592]
MGKSLEGRETLTASRLTNDRTWAHNAAPQAEPKPWVTLRKPRSSAVPVH